LVEVTVTVYAATATREGRWWVVDVEGVGTTQGRSVAEAQEMAEALVTDLFEVPAGTFTVKVVFEVPGMTEAVEAARRATEEAAAAQLRAADNSRRVARELKARGLSANDMAAVLRVSRARAQQLVKNA
jgi:hypothetical protein